MGLQLIVQSRKFFSQIKNGEDFSLLTGDFGTHLKGSVGEKMRMVMQLDIEWFSLSTASSPFIFDGTNTVKRSSGSFIADGFSVGDIADFFSPQGVPIAGNSRTILVLNDTFMIVDGPAFGVSTATDAHIRGLTELTGFIHSFGLIGNDEPFNFQSKVEGSDQIYTAKGVGNDPGGGRITTFIDAEAKGTILGWQSGSLKVRFVSNPSTYVQRFEIQHDFTILPFYQDGQGDDILAMIQPEILLGANTLKYAAQMEFRDVVSNPNTAKTFVDEISLGSVGGFDENFNGFNNKFSIDSIAYEETASGDSADGIIAGTKTHVTVVVNSLDSVFVAGSKFGVYHSKLPTNPEYTNQTDEFDDVWLYDSKIQTTGDAPISSTILKAVEATFGSAAQITIEFDVEFSVAQQILLSSDSLYVIGIQVTDNTLTTDNSDKVILVGDLREYVKSADIEGLLTLDAFAVYPHPVPTATGPAVGFFTDFKGWNEDGINLSFNIGTDLNEGAIIETANIRLVAFNSTTKDVFDLDNFSIPLGEQILVPDTPNPVQQINVSTNRGYRLKDDDFMNIVTFANSGRVGDIQNYLIRVGMKMRWETWIALPDADTVFYDNTEPNNNLNTKSSNYSLKEGYNIHAFLEFGMSKDGDVTQYVFRSPVFDVRDYDMDMFITPEWSADIKTFAPNGTDITPNFLSDDFTIMKVTWSNPTNEPITDITDIYAIHRIEENESQGQQIEELSSLAARIPVANQKMVALTGETRTKISIVGGKILTESRIDFNQLDANVNYDISARIGSITNTPVPTAGAMKTTESAGDKDTEGGDAKEIE